MLRYTPLFHVGMMCRLCSCVQTTPPPNAPVSLLSVSAQCSVFPFNIRFMSHVQNESPFTLFSFPEIFQARAGIEGGMASQRATQCGAQASIWKQFSLQGIWMSSPCSCGLLPGALVSSHSHVNLSKCVTGRALYYTSFLFRADPTQYPREMVFENVL